MWRDKNGNYGPLAYALLVVLFIATAVVVWMVVSTTGSHQSIIPGKINP